MSFEKKVPEWTATGTEPPASLKEKGFEVGYKPPAAYFNWFWHAVSECLNELYNEAVPHELVDTTDLNVLIATGVYGYTTRCTNRPSENSGVVHVYGFDTLYVTQIAHAHTINRVYIRYSANAGTTWTVWSALAYDSEKAPSGFGLGDMCTDISRKNLLTEVPKKSGFYRGSNVVNAPTENWWYFIITAGSDTTNVIAFGKDGTFRTAQFTNSSESIEWKSFSAADHTHSPGEVGALPSAGGTMTGDLYLSHKWGALWADNGNTGMAHYTSNEDISNATSIRVSDKKTGGEELQLTKRRNGANTNYKIYGEHHKPTPAEIGAAAVDHTHYNLLVNGDFADVVNQRGGSSYSGTAYGIDRWYGRSVAQTVKPENGRVTVTATGSAYVGIKQKVLDIAKYAGKTLTFACRMYAGGTPRLRFANASDTELAGVRGTAGQLQTLVLSFTVPAGATPDSVVPTIMLESTASGDNMQLYWAALYEGEYTAENLPAYQPKGYAAELAECRRYFYRVSTSGYGVFGQGYIVNASLVYLLVPVPKMRLASPTFSHEGSIAADDGWTFRQVLSTYDVTVNGWTDAGALLHFSAPNSYSSAETHCVLLREYNGKAASITFDCEL